MRSIILVLVLLITLSSCQKRLQSQTSVLEAYKQYQVLVQVKSELRKQSLDVVRRMELIAFGEELAPKDAELKLIKASAFRMNGELDKAQLALENAIEISPNYSPALSAYGELLIENGFYQEGKTYCLHAVKLNPVDLRARNCIKK